MAGTIVANTINTDTGLFSTNNAYLGIAKAWVNFVGSSGTTNASFNVSSVTRVGAGQYTINFTTAMPNIYYVTTTAASNNSTSGVQTGAFCWGTQTTTTTNIATTNGAANIQDQAVAYVAVFSS